MFSSEVKRVKNKVIIKRMIKILCLLMAFVGIFVVATKVLQEKWYFSLHINSPETENWQAFYDEPKDSLDVIFLGSSHVYNGINPVVFYEETGLKLREYSLRGLVRFYSDRWEAENMYLYTATAWSGELKESCSEGELRWIPIKDIPSLSLWEGDRIFLEALSKGEKDIALSLYYEGDKLTKALWD